jgi:hypothetical protein
MSNITKRENIKIAVGIIVFLIVIPIMFLTLPKKSDGVWINCSISEISPDFTTEMREACRQARIQSIQKDIQQPK